MTKCTSLFAISLILIPFQVPAADKLQDCAACPLMVKVEKGAFPRAQNAGDTPVTVEIGYDFALGKCEVTVGEFSEFARATNLRPKGCQLFRTTGDVDFPEGSWDSPGFRQRDSRPVVCVSWDDANAYAEWLSVETGETYRLPSESEWEFAARAGAGHDSKWFMRGNLKTGQAKCATCYGSDVMGREDELTTANVGGPHRNAFGISDMLGNAAEWTLDCAGGEMAEPPVDGSARLAGDCGERITRGGAFHSDWAGLSRYRVARDRGQGRNDLGFRVLREIGDEGSETAFGKYAENAPETACK